MRIGFVGAGVIGGGMARRAMSAGHAVGFRDLDAGIVATLVQEGAHAMASARELAATSDVVVVCLPRAEDVDAACRGAEGILAGLRVGTVVIDASSTPPAGAAGLQSEVAARGGHFIDAPLCPSQNREIAHRPVPAAAAGMNAGARAAWAGNLCFFVGGSNDDVARARPVLEVLGIECHHVGPVGAGKLVKLLHNAINITALAAISETMVVAKRSGLDVKVVIDALTTSLADSAMLRTQGRDFIAKQHFPRGLFPLHYSLKDLRYAMDCARAVGVQPTVTAATQDLYARAAKTAWGDYYNPAIFRFIEEESAPPNETARKV